MEAIEYLDKSSLPVAWFLAGAPVPWSPCSLGGILLCLAPLSQTEECSAVLLASDGDTCSRRLKQTEHTAESNQEYRGEGREFPSNVYNWQHAWRICECRPMPFRARRLWEVILEIIEFRLDCNDRYQMTSPRAVRCQLSPCGGQSSCYTKHPQGICSYNLNEFSRHLGRQKKKWKKQLHLEQGFPNYLGPRATYCMEFLLWPNRILNEMFEEFWMKGEEIKLATTLSWVSTWTWYKDQATYLFVHK